MPFSKPSMSPARLFCCLLLTPFGAEAESAQSTSLPTVIVLPNSSDDPDAAASGTLIAREDIEASKTTNLNALLRGENGVQLNQATASTSTGVTVGGASGGLGLVTLDGVPLFANVTGSYSLQPLLAEFIERVDVQRAGGGELSASRTLGGTIHLQSRELRDKAYAKFETGNYGTFRGGAGKGWQTPFGDWSAQVERLDISDGYTQASPVNGNHESDNYQLWNGLLRGRKRFARGEADATLMYSRGREDLDGPGRLPNGKFGWMDAPQGLGYNQTWLAQGRVQQQLTSRWLGSLQFGMTRNRQDVDIPLLPYTFAGHLWMLRWQNHHDLLSRHADQSAAWSASWGVDLQQQHGQSLTRFANRAETLTSAAAFLQSRAAWQDWQLTAETRLEDHQDYGSKALFSGKLTRRLSDGLQFWLAGGSGFRPPAVNERLNPLFGNVGLKPESVFSAEIGGRWQLSPGRELKATLSHRDYRQLIVMQFDSQSGRTASANVAQAEIWMAEGEWRQRWNDAWETGLSYTFTDAHNPLTGLAVPIRAAHQGKLWQSWQIDRQWQVRVELHMRDSFWFDRANTVKNTPAPRLNAVLDYRPLPQIDLYLRGENLNSEHSPEVNNFGYPGVTFWGGIKTRF